MACQPTMLLMLALLAFTASTSQAAYYGPEKTMNVIDSCWRWKPDWENNRRALADCAVGFGKDALGGKLGEDYVVTDPSDDPENPWPGTLRYGVIQPNPMWITFATDMVIILKNVLMINSFKTIDGRGAKVEIAYGPCITIEHVSHVIIHGIQIHDCKAGEPGMVRYSPMYAGPRGSSDGDGILIFHSSDVWIDHCYLARGPDGLIDAVHASTAITISNNYFTQHDAVMLLGNDDKFEADKVMKVTVAFNHFGPGLVQRIPRVRMGYAHVANNMYDAWGMYAIGGSANPTIFSEGNYFMASDNRKEVTKRNDDKTGWQNWNWKSSKDKFMNGAYFVPSGYGNIDPGFTRSQSFWVADGSMVPVLTSDAGPLPCSKYSPC